MSIEIDAGRIQIIDGSGYVALDTNGKLFHQTDYLSGSVSIPLRSSGINADVNVNTTTTLGSCSADATHVIGAFQVTYPGTTNESGIPGFGWFNVGGSYLHWFDGSTFTSAGYANNPAVKANLSQFSLYTFRVASGSFLLDEWVRIAGYTTGGIASSYSMYAFTMNYRLRAGLFT